MAEMRDFNTKCKALHLAASEVTAWLDKHTKDISQFAGERNGIERDVEGLKKQKEDLSKSVADLIVQRKKIDDEIEQSKKNIASTREASFREVEKLTSEAKKDYAEVQKAKEKLEADRREFEKEREAFNVKAKKVAELVGAR